MVSVPRRFRVFFGLVLGVVVGRRHQYVLVLLLLLARLFFPVFPAFPASLRCRVGVFMVFCLRGEMPLLLLVSGSDLLDHRLQQHLLLWPLRLVFLRVFARLLRAPVALLAPASLPFVFFAAARVFFRLQRL